MTLGEMAQLPDSQVTIITTGSQAEPMSSLTRIARDDHKQIKIKKGRHGHPFLPLHSRQREGH